MLRNSNLTTEEGSKLKKRYYILLIVLLFGVGVVWVHNVPKKVTQSDKEFLAKIFSLEIADAQEMSFEEQISFIDKAVDNLHYNMQLGVPISFNKNREPQNLFENKGGLCYDFSRSLEKLFLAAGFKTRHVAVYVDQGGSLPASLQTNSLSHSLTEVKTAKGWMIVDSNYSFYALDENGNVYSYEALSALEDMPNWNKELPEHYDTFYNNNISSVYGLYSRHGKFYKPYTPIPDYNLRELLYNF